MSLKIYSWNVNGIRSVIKKGVFTPFIDEHKPEILCLQETKAQEGQAQIDLPDYKEYWCSAERKGYSGTAIFSRKEPLNVARGLPEEIVKAHGLENDGYGDPAHEGRVISAEFKKFHLVTVYTPNSKDDLSRVELRHKHWDPAFLAYVNKLEASKPVIFCGDLNVAHTQDDLARPKPNLGKRGFTDQEREGFQRFIEAGFVDTFRLFTKGSGHYTWWTHWANARARNVGWRIDYFLASRKIKDQIKSSTIHADVLGSDHCPISIDVGL